jgi:hypothetical protein
LAGPPLPVLDETPPELFELPDDELEPPDEAEPPPKPEPPADEYPPYPPPGTFTEDELPC